MADSSSQGIFSEYQELDTRKPDCLIFLIARDIRKKWRSILVIYILFQAVHYFQSFRQVMADWHYIYKADGNRRYAWLPNTPEGQSHVAEHILVDEGFAGFPAALEGFGFNPWLSPDFIVMVETWATQCFAILLTDSRDRVRCFNYYNLLLSIMFFLRALTIVFTVEAPPDKECFLLPAYELPMANQTFLDSLSRARRVSDNTAMTCNDCFFSGHTTYLTACFWVLFEFSRKRRALFVGQSGFMLVFGLTSMLSIKFHYSIDLVSGFLFTTLVHYFLTYVPHGQALLEAVGMGPDGESVRQLMGRAESFFTLRAELEVVARGEME